MLSRCASLLHSLPAQSHSAKGTFYYYQKIRFYLLFISLLDIMSVNLLGSKHNILFRQVALVFFYLPPKEILLKKLFWLFRISEQLFCISFYAFIFPYCVPNFGTEDSETNMLSEVFPSFLLVGKTYFLSVFQSIPIQGC